MVLLPLLLGGAGIYLLLPRPGKRTGLAGALACGLALLLAGALLVHWGPLPVENILFYIFAAIAIAGGGLLVTQRNPVHAALSFALVVLSTCGLFLLQAAPFLMAATTIIYAGAIIVTFVFVIMLAQQAGLSDADHRSREPALACIAGFVLLGALLFVLHGTYTTRSLDNLLERTAAARNQDTVDSMRRTLGDPDNFLSAYRDEAANFRVPLPMATDMENAANELQLALRKEGLSADQVRGHLDRVYDAGWQARQRLGSLDAPPPVVPSFDRLPKNAQGEPIRDRAGQVALPHENVAHLGRLLFTDYLLAVELGGTLLLAATIGAIAIAGRRTEGLR